MELLACLHMVFNGRNQWIHATWHVEMQASGIKRWHTGMKRSLLANIFNTHLTSNFLMAKKKKLSQWGKILKPKKRIKTFKRHDWFCCKSCFWMLKIFIFLYELQNILISWEFCVKVYCRFFIVLFCKLTFIRLASHMNNFPVSACCLLDQIIGILMTILKVQVSVLDWAVPAASRRGICVKAVLISDSNSNHTSKFWI